MGKVKTGTLETGHDNSAFNKCDENTINLSDLEYRHLRQFKKELKLKERTVEEETESGKKIKKFIVKIYCHFSWRPLYGSGESNSEALEKALTRVKDAWPEKKPSCKGERPKCVRRYLGIRR